MNNKGTKKLKQITTEAKKLYKTGKYAKWTDAVKAASKSLAGWTKGGTRIIEVGEAPRKNKKNILVTRRKKAMPGTFKKFKQISGAKKTSTEKHTDTKSHNVNIRVVSGFINKINGLFDISAINDIDQLKKQYFQLAKKYHPDAGGTDSQFQQLQNEYEKHLKSLLAGSKLTNEQKENELQLDKALRDAANALAGLPGITIELVGKWLWVTGYTYPIRTQLSAAGFTFAGKKKAWYYKGSESSGRGNLTMEEIKKKYGSTKINPDDFKKLNGIGTISSFKKKRFMAAIKKAVKALNKRII